MRHLLDGVAMPVPHSSDGTRAATSSPRNAPDSLVDFHTGEEGAKDESKGESKDESKGAE